MIYRNKLGGLTQQMGLKIGTLLLGLIIFTGCKTTPKQGEGENSPAPVTTPETPKEEPKKEVTKTQEDLQKELKKAFTTPLEIAYELKEGNFKFAKKKKGDLVMSKIEKKDIDNFLTAPNFYSSTVLLSFIMNLKADPMIKAILEVADNSTKIGKKKILGTKRIGETPKAENADLALFISIIFDLSNLYDKDKDGVDSDDIKDFFTPIILKFYPNSSPKVYAFDYYEKVTGQSDPTKKQYAGSPDQSVQLAFRDLYSKFEEAYGLEPLENIVS